MRLPKTFFWTLALLMADQLLSFLIVRLRPEWINVSGARLVGLLPLVATWAIAGLLLIRFSRYPAVALMAAGFLSNMASRLAYGYFIDVIPMRFWISSTADLLVVAGCLLCLVRNAQENKRAAS